MNTVMVKFNSAVKTSDQAKKLLLEVLKEEEIGSVESKYSDMIDGLFAVEVSGDVKKTALTIESIKQVQYAHEPATRQPMK